MNVLDFINRILSERRLKRLCRQEDFHVLVHREKQFSRRLDSNASLIIFDTGATGTPVTVAGLLVETIRTSTRTTDVVGWYENRRIGLLLPDTSMEGAQRVLDAIMDRLRTRTSSPALPHTVIHTYSGDQDIESGNGNGDLIYETAPMLQHT